MVYNILVHEKYKIKKVYINCNNCIRPVDELIQKQPPEVFYKKKYS